ncbi:hypothetical protein [Rhizobium nepotum]|uniref:hypothetical protein n=1 Tax=Rhizobium nepotum TaxID=1035271 RepID=UPI003CE6C37C
MSSSDLFLVGMPVRTAIPMRRMPVVIPENPGKAADRIDVADQDWSSDTTYTSYRRRRTDARCAEASGEDFGRVEAYSPAATPLMKNESIMLAAMTCGSVAAKASESAATVAPLIKSTIGIRTSDLFAQISGTEVTWYLGGVR